MSHDIVSIGAAQLDPKSRALLVQAKGAATDEEGSSAPDFGLVPVFSALGLTAMPSPANENGSAEAVLATDVPGRSAALVGARDVRTASIVGNLKPGDTVLHSTDPQLASQVQCKGAERQTCLLSRDSQGRTMMALLDGKNDKVQITALGAHIEIDTRGNISLTAADGTGIMIGDGNVQIAGKLIVGTPIPGLSVALCAPTGYPLGGIIASQTSFAG